MQTPVAFLVFNRPEQTARVFARIREARPERLFVVADGPRPDRPGEAAKCRQVRELIEQGIDWPCEVNRDYSDVNLGCGRRVSSGISRAFEQVEEAIILEDDCLPDPTFFPFCSELLDRYRDAGQVGTISGSHHLRSPRTDGPSYYFSRYGNIWGWATWRRAWQCFDFDMKDWPTWRDSGGVERLFPDARVARFWKRVWDATYRGEIDTWDYQWTYSYMKAGLLGVQPRAPLIENIGYGGAATHTSGNRGDEFDARGHPMRFPLKHPPVIEPDNEAEQTASARFFSQQTAWGRLRSRLSSIFMSRKERS